MPLHLDSNVWNFLFDFRLSLGAELPLKDFAFYTPRQIEIEDMADLLEARPMGSTE
jgi:hypothetical protein